MKYALVHPTLSGSQVADDEASALACKDAIEQDTGIPGFVRIIPDPIPARTLAEHRYRQFERRRAPGSLRSHE
jgi:hypothetical protein